MRATSGRPRRTASEDAAPNPAEDSFEEIRDTFCIRLRGERDHFLTLNAALTGTDDSPVPVLGELRNRAHRLSGTAAIFEFAAVAAAARALELTLVTASGSLADNAEMPIRLALDALVRAIEDLEPKPAPVRTAEAGSRSGSRRASTVLHG
jgi:HPt (histidine-containing phosphotransfer) domain-containing protein